MTGRVLITTDYLGFMGKVSRLFRHKGSSKKLGMDSVVVAVETCIIEWVIHGTDHANRLGF